MLQKRKQAAVLKSEVSAKKLGQLYEEAGIAYTCRTASPGGIVEGEKRLRTHMGSIEHHRVYYMMVDKADLEEARRIWHESNLA